MTIEKLDVYISKDGIKWFNKEACEKYEKESIELYDKLIREMNVMKSRVLPRIQKEVYKYESSLKEALAKTDYNSRIDRLHAVGLAYRNLEHKLTEYKAAQKRYSEIKSGMRNISKAFGIRRPKTSVKVSGNEQ